MSALNKEALEKAVVFGRKKKKGTCKMWNGPNKTTKDHTINNWQGKTYCGTWLSHLTRPSCWCWRWTRKHHKRLLCLGEGKRQCKMWNGSIKTTRTKQKYQQFARKDVLYARVVTLDTSHLLRSALNKEVPWKAVVCLGEGRRKVRCEMDQNKSTKDHNYQQLARRLTAIQSRHTWHDPLADVGVERGSTIKGCCV